MDKPSFTPDPNSRKPFERFEHDIRVAAAEIKALGERGVTAHVWADYATIAGYGDASLRVGASGDVPGFRTGRWVKPNDCAASGHRSWGTVPFDQILHILRKATADVPVIARATDGAA